MEPDPKIKLIRDKIREGLIERIPRLFECLDKLLEDEYVKFYLEITDIVERRKSIANNNK